MRDNLAMQIMIFFSDFQDAQSVTNIQMVTLLFAKKPSNIGL